MVGHSKFVDGISGFLELGQFLDKLGNCFQEWHCFMDFDGSLDRG